MSSIFEMDPSSSDEEQESHSSISSLDCKRLIELVYSHRHLWDKNHRSHRNRYVLARTWSEIASELNSSKETARLKWRSLRETFQKRLKQEKEHPDEMQFIERRYSWPHFKAMDFLRGQMEMDEKPLQQTLEEFMFVEVEEEEDAEVEPSLVGDDIFMYEYDDSSESGVPTEVDPFVMVLQPHIDTLSDDRRMLLEIKLQQLVYDFVYIKNNCENNE